MHSISPHSAQAAAHFEGDIETVSFTSFRLNQPLAVIARGFHTLIDRLNNTLK